MKSIIFNTDEISFTVGSESDRPNNIHPFESNTDYKTFRKVAVAFLCVEDDDLELDAFAIVKEFLKYSRMVGRKILVIPFVHLTSRPASPKRAVDFIRLVSKTLEERNVLEGTGGFGFHKSLIAK